MGKKKLDLKIGEKFGMLTVIKELELRESGRVMWLCICDCGGEKEVRGSSLKHGSVKSCGCLARPPFPSKCSNCGKDIFVRNERKNAKNHFCDRRCMGLFNSKQRNPNFEEGESSKKGFYMWKKNGDDWQPEHIIIAEKVLGRKLKSGEVVHHINLKKTDNRNENLIICTRGYHSSLHQNMGKKYAELFL